MRSSEITWIEKGEREKRGHGREGEGEEKPFPMKRLPQSGFVELSKALVAICRVSCPSSFYAPSLRFACVIVFHPRFSNVSPNLFPAGLFRDKYLAVSLEIFCTLTFLSTSKVASHRLAQKRRIYFSRIPIYDGPSL